MKVLDVPVSVDQMRAIVAVNVVEGVDPDKVLAQFVEDANTDIEITHNGLWIEPDIDNKVLKMHGRVVKYGNATLRSISPEEVALLYREHPESKSA